MHEGYAAQYDCPCVVIEGPEEPDAVIAFAKEIGAINRDEGDEDYVIEFRHDDRLVGPEVYTEEALRSSLRRINRANLGC